VIGSHLLVIFRPSSFIPPTSFEMPCMTVRDARYSGPGSPLDAPIGKL
jgi:hypothetical protein